MTTTGRTRPHRRTLAVPAIYACVALVVFTATRIALAAWTGASELPLSAWPRMLALGGWFDIVVVAAMLAPFLLYEAIVPARWRRAPLHRALRVFTLFLVVFALLFGAVAEGTFWLEFQTRFNFIAVDYLLYTHEVLGNIRESYPVPAILGVIGLAASFVTYALRAPLARADTPLSRRTRAGYAIAALAVPAVLLAAARVEQMEGSGNAYADELAGNGLFTLAAAARRNELDYDRFYATIPQERADAILAGVGVDRQPLHDPAFKAAEHESSEPHVPGTPRAPRHVVLIMVESLSAQFLGSYGSPQGLTPNLDRLASRGLRFANVYATGTRTVRGLEAVSLGTPPVPGQAIVRRPGNEHLSTLGELLEHQGFATAFVYGGYGYFDNMNAYFGANDYHVVDRTDFPRSSIVFENAWGVADEVLFDNALRVMDANVADGRRSFMHIMTTSNHRPFTYPDGRIDIRSPGGREGAVKYTDYAIGRFIDAARSKPWFDDTLFVIVADHCAAVAGKTKLPVAGYRIPLILYAPKLVDPGVVERTVSQMDVAPTLLDLLKVDGDDYFFGRSAFELPPAPERAFVSNYQSLGYLRSNVLTVLSPGRKVETFAVDPSTFETRPIALDRTLADEAIAYYQTAARAFKRGALAAPAYRGS